MSLLTSLISYWKLDEASGDATDAHGSNTLTDNNTVGSATGKINNGRDFEADNSEYLSHADNAGLSTGDIDFTFACWVKAESFGAANRRIINKINSAVTALEFQLFYKNNLGEDLITWEVFDGSGAVGSVSGGAMSTGTWYFIVVDHDASANTISIQGNNGTKQSAATTGSPANTSAPFTLGSLDGLAGTFWDGLIDEVGFWKRILTTQERTDLYNSGAGLAYSNFGGSLEASDAVVDSVASGSVTISCAAASDGSSPYTYQLKRGTDGVTFGTSVGSPQTTAGTPTPVTDSGLTDGALYYWRWEVTDDAAASDNSSVVSAVPHAAGSTFYISSSGNNSNSGLTTGAPWADFTKVNLGVLPGDTVLLNLGDTITDNLLLDGLSTTSLATITIGTYGSGSQATIDCGDSYGIQVKNMGWVTIHGGIKVTGSGVNVSGTFPNKTGTTTSTEGGISILATTPGTWYGGIVIDNVEVTGCLHGISFFNSTAAATAAFEDFALSNIICHDCGASGVRFMGVAVSNGGWFHFGILYRDGTLSNITCYNIRGITSYGWTNGSPAWNGFGIMTWHCQRVTLETFLVYTCGEASPNDQIGGIAGALMLNCDTCTYRYGEAYDCFGPEGRDGTGLDIDWYCNDCVIEYCYTHDNDMAGMSYWSGTVDGQALGTGNVYRFCVSANNGRNVPTYLAGGFVAYAGSGSIVVHNCTFYVDADDGDVTRVLLVEAGITASFYNNIFIAVNGASFGLDSTSAGTYKGNCWYAGTGSSFSVTINGVTYTSIADMRTAGYEKVSTTPVGIAVDPQLSDVGNGGTYTLGQANRLLTAYDPIEGSPVIGAGLDLSSLFSVNPGTRDFHRRSNHPASGYVIGAAVFPTGGGRGMDNRRMRPY